MADFYPVPIFTDFEGVLRPAFSHGGPFFCAKELLAPLEEALALGLSPCLIVASTHRLEFDWRELAKIIDRDAPGLGRFFAGATPYGPRAAQTPDEMLRYAEAPRLFEAEKWLEPRPAPFGWLCVDDSPELFGEVAPPQLLLCQSHRGFGAPEAHELSKRLRELARAIPRPAPRAA